MRNDKIKDVCLNDPITTQLGEEWYLKCLDNRACNCNYCRREHRRTACSSLMGEHGLTTKAIKQSIQDSATEEWLQIKKKKFDDEIVELHAWQDDLV